MGSKVVPKDYKFFKTILHNVQCKFSGKHQNTHESIQIDNKHRREMQYLGLNATAARPTHPPSS